MIVTILEILLLLAGSAFFSASEMALSSANRLRLTSAAEDGDYEAKTAVWLLDRFDRVLSAILMGNDLCNIGADSLLTVLMVTALGARYRSWVSVLTTAAMTLFVIFFCESAPKIAAKKNANRASMEFAGVLRLLTWLLTPAVWLVTALIRLITAPFKGEDREPEPEEAAAELQSIIETVEDEGILDEDRSELLLSALDFSQIPVMDVMTARVDVEALDADADWREVLLTGEAMPYSRMPVYEGSIDDIIGVLVLNRFFKAVMDDPETTVRSQLMKPLYMYKTVKLPDALKQFRKAQQHMAVVTDEYGGTLGVVTLEDVLEQLVGEIWDETDEVETEVVARPDGEFEVDGDLPVADFAELLGLTEEELRTDSATAGGWTIEKCGEFPTVGRSVTAEGVCATVLAMDADGRRVEKILVRRTDGKEEK